MPKKHLKLLALFSIFLAIVLCKSQNKTELPKDIIQSETIKVITSYGPLYLPFSELQMDLAVSARTLIQYLIGNIWPSSDKTQGWVLSRYDEKSLSNKYSTANELNLNGERILFRILEAVDGSIWFGADSAYRYDDNAITEFKSD